jgi:hypothetical protein
MIRATGSHSGLKMSEMGMKASFLLDTFIKDDRERVCNVRRQMVLIIHTKQYVTRIPVYCVEWRRILLLVELTGLLSKLQNRVRREGRGSSTAHRC